MFVAVGKAAKLNNLHSLAASRSFIVRFPIRYLTTAESKGMWQHPQHHRRKVRHVDSAKLSSSDEPIDPEQTFYFVRHGLTEMNEVLHQMEWGSPGFFDKGLWDTKLSAAGVEQAIELHKQWREQFDAEPSPASHVVPWENVDLVVVSPLVRTMQTYELLVEHTSPPLIDPAVPRYVHPLLRERLYLSSDAGSPRSVLQLQFPRFDFSSLPQDDSPWWYTPEQYEEDYGPYVEWRPPGKYLCPGEPTDVFYDRLEDLRKSLLRRPEKHILVVAHWGTLRGLTGGDFKNFEVRAVKATDLLPEPFVDP